jgi:hypothetical protein
VLLLGTTPILAGADAGASSGVATETRMERLQAVLEHQPAYFSKLRVCAYPAFSLADRRCTHDQRKGVLLTGKFACSVSFDVRRAGRLHARMTYQGVVVHQYSTRALDTGPWTAWISENAGAIPLPGGRWGCRFSFGSAHVRARFRSVGPTGPVLGAAVCSAKHSFFYAHHRIRQCKADESARPIPATDRILCSALFVLQTGKRGEVQLLADGQDAAKPDVERVPAPLSLWWTPFAPAHPTGDGTFAPGAYVCRFSVDGAAVVEKPFQIVPA